MPKPRLSDVYDTLAAAVQAALSAANLTGTAARGRIEVGWPNPNYLAARIKAGNPLVTIFATARSSNSTRSLGHQYLGKSYPASTLTATVEPGQITFAGSPAAGVNVHIFPGYGAEDVFYETVAGDTLQTIATGVEAAINASTTMTATVDTDGVTVLVENAPELAVNLGLAGTLLTENGRSNRDIQISVWAPDDATREAIADVIFNAIGTEETCFLALSDQTALFVDFRYDVVSDQMEDDYTVYVSHLLYTVDYAVVTETPLTQITTAVGGVSVNNASLELVYESGASS